MRPTFIALLAALACAWAPATPAADAERGKGLYETRCDGCHAQSVHGRAKREAADFEAVRAWVRRWSGQVGAKWSAEEVDDVAVYLNQRYYRFACPPPACSSTSDAGTAPYIVGSR